MILCVLLCMCFSIGEDICKYIDACCCANIHVFAIITQTHVVNSPALFVCACDGYVELYTQAHVCQLFSDQCENVERIRTCIV